MTNTALSNNVPQSAISNEVSNTNGFSQVDLSLFSVSHLEDLDKKPRQLGTMLRPTHYGSVYPDNSRREDNLEIDRTKNPENHPFGLYNGGFGSSQSRVESGLISFNSASQAVHPESWSGDTGARGQVSKSSGPKTVEELEELYKKLNPFAKEFVPRPSNGRQSVEATPSSSSDAGLQNKQPRGSRAKKKIDHGNKEHDVKRTVYVADIDNQVTEEDLASLFLSIGEVVDCRICGDPNSVLRFAFVEFTDEEGAKEAIKLSGTVLGSHPLKVFPSKTAIVPVNPGYLPKTEDERDLCARTIYCANIDKTVTQADIRLFFESLCGQVSKLRLLGDHQHNSRIAFVEFEQAESAVSALNCSGAILGSLPLRISPSKTPVRSRGPRTQHSRSSG